MSQAEELFEVGLNNYVIISKVDGKPIVKLPFWLAIILTIGAPQLLVLVLIAIALEWVTVHHEKCC